MRRPQHIRDGGQITRALVEQRIADIDMIEEHMRRARKAVIDDPVGNADLIAPDIGFDPPDEMEILAEHRRLLHSAFGPEDATVTVPAFAIAGEPGRNRADAPMQRMPRDLSARIVVIVRRHFDRPENVVETARGEKA
jgi:hypothetical protein